MHITILTSGSRGDVQPYIALGVGLRRTGDNVRLSAPETFGQLVSTAGLDFVPLRNASPQDFVRRPGVQATFWSGSQLRMLLSLVKEAATLIEGLLDEFAAACQGADLVITAGTFAVFAESAESVGVPWLPALLHPLVPTRQFPAPFLSNGPMLGGTYNRLTHHLFDQAVWQAGRSAIQRRRKRLGEAPPPIFGPYRRIRARRLPFLFGFSPAVIPKPPDWPDTHHITGYWFLDEVEEWQPPAELVRFLEAGPPPVCIGFGSMNDEHPERLTQLALEALALSHQRGILLSGWSGLGTTDLPEAVYRADALPHTWLFPRVAAVVHHGGAGTTAAGLRAGRPTIITPFVGDQFFWQKMVVELGVGPQVPHYKRLTAEQLGQAIKTAVSDTAMQARAAALGAKIQAEEGVGCAVEIIHRYLH